MSYSEVKTRRILGIDPGSRVTGFGVIETRLNKQQYIASGCVRVKSDNLSERLQQIYQGIKDVVFEYNPDEVAIEQVFMHTNAGGALKLGQARGAAIVATGVSVAEYSARQIKQAVVGYGAADKNQVQQMVKALLGITGNIQSDAADGLAIAICHSNFSTGVAGLSEVSSIRKGRLK